MGTFSKLLRHLEVLSRLARSRRQTVTAQMCVNCGHLRTFDSLVFDSGLSNLGQFEAAARRIRLSIQSRTTTRLRFLLCHLCCYLGRESFITFLILSRCAVSTSGQLFWCSPPSRNSSAVQSVYRHVRVISRRKENNLRAGYRQSTGLSEYVSVADAALRGAWTLLYA
jgi:hypothetical protein